MAPSTTDTTTATQPTDSTRRTSSTDPNKQNNAYTEAYSPENRKLWTQKKPETAEGLPDVTIDDGTPVEDPASPPLVAPEEPGQPSEEPAAQQLSGQALNKTVEELHDAINRRNESLLNRTNQGIQAAWKFVTGSDERTDLNDPDKEKISALLEPLTQADRQAIEKLYHEKYGKDGPADTLRNELKDKVGKNDDNSTEWRKMESVLNRADGRTNDAGALMVAITETHTDKDKGNAQIRSVLATLAAQAPEGSEFSGTLDQLEKDFQAQYHMSFKDALKDADLTDATKEALPILEKGVDKRTADDVQKLAEIALTHNDTHLFGESLSGDNPATIEARKRLSADQNFLDKISQAFQGDDKDIAMDYVKEGRISLGTIAEKNLHNWIFDNKDNVSLATENATDKEREQFAEGRRLADGKVDPNTFTPDQKLAYDFYKKIDQAFHDATGEGRQIAIWEDKLEHGRSTLITQLAETHHPGITWDVAGLHMNLGRSRDTNEFFTAAENLGEEDWKLLHDPTTREQYRRELEQSLGTYVDDDGQRQRIMDLIDKKASAESYEASQKIHRSLEQAIEDNKDHIVGGEVVGIGTDYKGDNILRNLTDLSAEDAKKYHDDPSFRQKIDEFFASTNVNDTERLYAQQVLRQVSETGKPPELDAQLTLLKDAAINGEEQEIIIRDAEALLKDETVRARLNKPDDQLSAEDKKIKEIIDSAISAQYEEHGPYTAPPAEGVPEQNPEITKLSNDLFNNGKLSFEQKMTLGFSRQAVLTDIAAASPQEREQILSKLSADEQAIVKHAAENGGKLDLADRLRMFAIGDEGSYQSFKEELSKLDHQQIQDLKGQYSQLFNSSLDADFLGKVDEADRTAYTELLTPSESDGRQTFYDNVTAALDNSGGFTVDGSELTLQRSLDQNRDLLAEFQRQYQNLPPEKQQALDQYFNGALDQYVASKEKLADVVVEATITAVALAAAPFTGGTSLALVASVAFAAGAAFKVAANQVILGGSYDKSEILHDIVSGGTLAAVNFFGGSLFRGVASTFDSVTGKIVADAASATALKEGEQQAVQRAVTGLLTNGQTLSREQIVAAVSKEAPELAGNQALIDTLVTSIGSSSEDIAAAAVKLQTAQSSFGRVIAENTVIGAMAGAALPLVEAPFSPNGIDVNSLLIGTLAGASIGAVIPVAFKSIIGNRTVQTNLLRTEDGVVIDTNPKMQSEPITVLRNGETITVSNDGKPFQLRDGDQIIDGPSPHNALSEPLDGIPPATQQKPTELTPGHELELSGPRKAQDIPPATVQGEANVTPQRLYTVDGKTYRLDEAGNWFYGSNRTSPPGAIKVHVTTDSPEDLALLQRVLIPALEDPHSEISKLAAVWKTFDPQAGVNPSKAWHSVDPAGNVHPYPYLPTGLDNSAKAFTIYAKDPADALRLQSEIDKLLSDTGLGLSRPIPTGNVDRILGTSNRVGIVRDHGVPAIDERGKVYGALLDGELATKIKQSLRVPNDSKLSAAQLGSIEDTVGLQRGTLQNERNGEGLVLKLTTEDNKVSPAGVYLDESSAIKVPRSAGSEVGGLTNRPAFFALSENYGLSPIETYIRGLNSKRATQATTLIEGQPLQPNKNYLIGRSTESDIVVANNPTVSREHASVRVDEEGNRYITDLGSSNGTYVNGNRIPPRFEVKLKSDDVVSLGQHRLLTDESPLDVALPTPPDHIPPTALSQSNEYALNNKISDHIEDGWSSAGTDVQFGANGHFDATRPAMVIDRQNDPYLRAALDEAKAKFAHLPPEERAVALTKWAQEKLVPPKMSEQELDVWYRNFSNTHAGERIYFGQFLKEGKGVCSQQSILLKLAADQFPDMRVTLQRGTFAGGPHAWTTFDFGDGKARIFDPRLKQFNLPKDSPLFGIYKPFPPKAAAPTPQQLKTGDQVIYNEAGGWQVLSIEGDNAVIVAPGIKDATIENVLAWNPNRKLSLGQTYVLERGNGTMDDGWVFTGRNPNGSLIFSKQQAFKKIVSRSELSVVNEP